MTISVDNLYTALTDEEAREFATIAFLASATGLDPLDKGNKLPGGIEIPALKTGAGK
jgi:predicted benzoate:H+ symporter BenE